MIGGRWGLIEHFWGVVFGMDQDTLVMEQQIYTQG
jgi:hypothetical protein